MSDYKNNIMIHETPYSRLIGRNILIVTENREFGRLIEDYFSPDYKVMITDNCEVVRILTINRFQPDIIINDIDGFLCSEENLSAILQKNTSVSIPPVLVVSGTDDKMVREVVTSNGVRGFIKKPLTLKYLESKINSILRIK